MKWFPLIMCLLCLVFVIQGVITNNVYTAVFALGSSIIWLGLCLLESGAEITWRGKKLL